MKTYVHWNSAGGFGMSIQSILQRLSLDFRPEYPENIISKNLWNDYPNRNLPLRHGITMSLHIRKNWGQSRVSIS